MKGACARNAARLWIVVAVFGACAGAQPPTDFEAPVRGPDLTPRQWTSLLMAWCERLRSDPDASQALESSTLAMLPSDEGFSIVEANWNLLTHVQAKRLVMEAFFHERQNPRLALISGELHAFRAHPRLVDVLHLGTEDPILEVRQVAFDLLRGVAFRDFTGNPEAYTRWREHNRALPLTEVLVNSSYDLVPRLSLGDDQQVQGVLAMLAERGQAIGAVPELKGALIEAGLLDVLAALLKARTKPEVTSETGESGVEELFSVLAYLMPDEAYLRREILPLTQDKTAGDTLRQHARLLLMAHPDLRRELLLEQLRGGEDLEVEALILEQLGASRDPKAIPPLIAIIEADQGNARNTKERVGRLGLAPLTGVPYDDSHTGPWWRRWWAENKDNYPPDAKEPALPSR